MSLQNENGGLLVQKLGITSWQQESIKPSTETFHGEALCSTAPTLTEPVLLHSDLKDKHTISYLSALLLMNVSELVPFFGFCEWSPCEHCRASSGEDVDGFL